MGIIANLRKENSSLGILGSMLMRLLIQRLLVPTLVLLLLTLGLAGFASHRSLDDQQNKLARVMASTVETFLQNAGNMLRAAAKVADQNEEHLTFYLHAASQGFAYFDTIYRLDNMGIVIEMEPYDPSFIGMDQSRQPFFSEAATSEKLNISRPFNSIRTGKPTVNLTWLLNDGGMMVAELNLGTLQEVIIDGQHEHSQSTIIIVDQAGTLLAHPRTDLIAQQARLHELPLFQGERKRETTSYFHSNNKWMLGSITVIKSTGWVVLVQIPLAALYAPLITAAIPVFLLCLMVWGLMAFAFQKRFRRFVVSPLTNLSQTAIAISSGDLDRSVTVEREDEIGIVARAFNSMTGQLREVISRLEVQVSQLTRTREDLKNHQEQLEGVVRARTVALTERTQQLEKQTVELTAAKQEAEEASSSKSEFLARMSHEIRTPLNAVTGLTNVVLKSDLTPEQRDYLNKVQIAGSNLLEVINDILDFSKVEAGQLELNHASFDLSDLMDQLTDLFSNRVAQKDLELIFALSPEVPRELKGDPNRLAQVLTNLVENAVKFTENGEIVVKVQLDGQREKLLGYADIKFSVSDTGIGIGDDMLPSLFDPFTQADSSLTRKQEGTGLGLAICKRLVGLMGGHIWAESTLGQGSVFAFMVRMEVGKEKTLHFKLPEDLHGLKTLVVDDSAAARQILDDLLTSFTFEVTTVESGKKALEELNHCVQGKPYKLVLLDWKMDRMDGIETAQAIRKLSNLDHPPIIIMVTAYGHELLSSHIDSFVVDSMLMKPIKASGLFNTIMELFGKKVSVEPRVYAERGDMEKLRERCVLVVEDSNLNRDVAVALLEEAGLKVETAENGRVAVEKVTNSPPKYFDAVLMDIQMPELDGFAATRRIRESTSDNRNVCIIALTAHALKGEREKCLNAGMNDYLPKPIDEKQLWRVLLKWVNPQAMNMNPENQGEQNNSIDVKTVLDVSNAMKRLGGRKQIYNKALSRFISESGKSWETIKTLLDAGDQEAAMLTAHTVKGTAAVIGAVDLTQIASQLEQTIRDTGLDIDDRLSAFKKELDKTLVAVREYQEKELEE